jgi:hypothetical protein
LPNYRFDQQCDPLEGEARLVEVVVAVVNAAHAASGFPCLDHLPIVMETKIYMTAKLLAYFEVYKNIAKHCPMD